MLKSPWHDHYTFYCKALWSSMDLLPSTESILSSVKYKTGIAIGHTANLLISFESFDYAFYLDIFWITQFFQLSQKFENLIFLTVSDFLKYLFSKKNKSKQKIWNFRKMGFLVPLEKILIIGSIGRIERL